VVCRMEAHLAAWVMLEEANHKIPLRGSPLRKMRRSSQPLPSSREVAGELEDKTNEWSRRAERGVSEGLGA
jgi:hypothetical protein